MADGVARVVVEADTGPAGAAFKKLQADAQRAMDAIGRSRAQATVDAKTTDFDRKIDDVKRKIAQLDGDTANPNVDIDSTEAQAELAALRVELKKLSSERATVRVDAKELRDANKLRDISAKKQAAMSKLYLDEEKAIDRATKARERQAASDERSVRSMASMQERAAREDAKRTEEGIKDVERLAKARREYGKVLGDVQHLETKTGRPGGIFRSAGETRDLEAAKAKAEGLAREVERLGGTIEDIDPDLERNQGVFGRWAGSLSKVRLQLGFFSATVSQVGKGLLGLGPILTGLGGGLISVVGVLGSGLAGATAVGAAGLAGFLGTAAGVGAIVVPMVKNFKEAEKASQNLTKAQKEYGKGSTQVKSAQEKLNHIMAGTDPAAKAAVKDYGQIKEQWKSLTAGAKPAVFNAFGQGIRTVQALLPGFAKQSVASTKVAGKAWDGWMASLRSPEAKQLLNTVLSNFRASIPGVANGLGSLAAAFGRITAAASKSLPSLSKGFENWADNVERSVGGGDALDKKIQNMVHDMQDLGHLTQDTGSLLVHILGASSKSGDDLVDSLDHVVNKWDEWATSTQGKDSLQNFFGEARQETEQFFQALSPLTRLLFQMSRAFAPITSGALKVVRVVGDMVHELAQLPGLKVGLEGVGAVLAGMWAVGKVKVFAGAVRDAAGAIKALFAAQGAEGGLGALLGLGGGAGGVKRDAAAASDAIYGVEAAETAATGGAGLLAAALSPEVLIPAAVVGGLAYLAVKLVNTKTAFEEAGEASEKAAHQLHNADKVVNEDGEQYNATVHHQVGLNKEATSAREALIKAQQKYGATSKQATQAGNELLHVEQEQVHAGLMAGAQRTENVKDARNQLSAARERVKAAREEISVAKEKVLASAGETGEVFADPEHAKHLAEAQKKYAGALREVSQAEKQLVVSNIPLERQVKGLKPISDTTEEALHKLSQTIGTAATKKIGNFVNAGDVAKIANLSNRLSKLGQGTQVKKIDVQSRGADQTLNKLQQLNRQTSRVQGKVATLTVHSNDQQANHSLQKLAQESQRLTGSSPTLKILANSDNAEQAIQALRAHLTALAHQKYEAIIGAHNATDVGSRAAYHNLREIASKKYEAILSARDNATRAIQPAKQSGQQFAKTYTAQLQVTGAGQAQGEISAVASALASLHDKTVNVTVATHRSGGGNFAGGHSVYMPSFAAGGIPTDPEIQRAARKAAASQMQPGGRGQKITRPTMLVGEQAPTYNEYVITENPNYRSSNERYLEEAAAGMNMGVVSAYKKGKGGDGGNKKGNNNGGNKGGNGGGNDSKQPSPDELRPKNNPPPEQSKPHRIVKVTKWGPVQTINNAETDIQVQEHKYNAERQQEEQEIQKAVNRGEKGHWKWNVLKGFLNKEKSDYAQIEAAVPKVEKRLTSELGRLGGLLDGGGRYSKSSEEGARKHVLDLEHEKDALKAPSKPSKGNMSEAQYKAATKKYEEKKQSYETHKTKLEHKIKAEKERQKHIEKERSRLESIREEAVQEQREIKQSFGEETEQSRKEVETSLGTLAGEESGELEPSYPEPENAKAEEEEKPIERAEAQVIEAELLGPSGATQLREARENLLKVAEGELARARQTPQASDDIEALNEIKSAKEALEEDTTKGGTEQSIGNQTTSLSQARQALYEQFASNITSANAAGPTPTGGYPAGALPNYSQEVLNNLAASKTVGGGFGVGPTPVGQTGIGSTPKAGSGTVMNVTNNFSTPPPDPHTFSKNLTFELNAG